jgi:hypothetical protein
MIANLVSNGAEDLGVGQYTVHVRSCVLQEVWIMKLCY